MQVCTVPQVSHSPGQGWIWRCYKRPKACKMVIDTHACALSSFPSCLYLTKPSQEVVTVKLSQHRARPTHAAAWPWPCTIMEVALHHRAAQPAPCAQPPLWNNQTSVQNWHCLKPAHREDTVQSELKSWQIILCVLIHRPNKVLWTTKHLQPLFIWVQSSRLPKKKPKNTHTFFVVVVHFQFYFQLT